MTFGLHKMIVNSTIQQRSPLPIVATPTTSSTLLQPSNTTTKAWLTPPQPPTPPPSATNKPLFDHPTTFRPDHPSAKMLGLHNILLIAPPSSSCHHHHHHHHNIHEPFNNNNNNNNNNNSSNNLNEPSFWSLKRRQESGNNKDNNGDDNDEEDDHHSLMKVCRDCGNRAKKECSFSRCRTCCKTRGYDCATHVRSTWVPTAKRREKKLSVDCNGGCGGGGSSGSSSCGVKRPRAALSSENVTATTSSLNAPPTLCFTGSVPQDASFKKSLPSQVKAPAVFRCISVTAINDGEAGEVAYVATANISGHVFKGFLYDQGNDEKNLFPCISKMQMEASPSVKNRDSSSVDPSTTFAASAT